LGCNTFVHGSNARNLYSYLYLNQQKCFVFLIIAYVFYSTKLEIRAEQVLPGSEEGWGCGRGSGKQGEEMAQTMYAHVNKKIRDKINLKKKLTNQ
jgi:hypothetical protein